MNSTDPGSDLAVDPRRTCLYCDDEAKGRCLRCDGPLCEQHLPARDRRCLACEWLGFHRRWWGRELITMLTLIVVPGVGIAMLTQSWIAAMIVAGPIAIAASYGFPFSLLEPIKRQIFLRERLPGLWYDHAHKLTEGQRRQLEG